MKFEEFMKKLPSGITPEMFEIIVDSCILQNNLNNEFSKIAKDFILVMDKKIIDMMSLIISDNKNELDNSIYDRLLLSLNLKEKVEEIIQKENKKE